MTSFAPRRAGLFRFARCAPRRSACPRGSAVLRSQQGPVREVRLPHPADVALRPVLLSRRVARRPRRRPTGRALVLAALGQLPPHLRPQVAGLLRRPSRLPADERHRRASSRRARAASPKACARASSCRSPASTRTTTTCWATSWCTSSSTASPRRDRAGSRASVPCRSGSSRAWPSTSRSAATIRSPRCGCATRPSATTSRRSSSSTPTRASSRTATGRRCGRTSAAAGAIAPWSTSTARRCASASRKGIRRVLGVSTDSLSKDWIRRRGAPISRVLEGRTRPNGAGDPVLQTGRRRGDMTLAPTVSPDGKLVAFFARRSLFEIELFVADARDGPRDQEARGPDERLALRRDQLHQLVGRVVARQPQVRVRRAGGGQPRDRHPRRELGRRRTARRACRASAR